MMGTIIEGRGKKEPKGGKNRGTIWVCATCPSSFLSTSQAHKIHVKIKTLKHNRQRVGKTNLKEHTFNKKGGEMNHININACQVK